MIAPWNEKAWAQLTGERRRNTHSWLLAGPPGLGKLDLALACSRRVLGEPDNFDSTSNPDFHVLIPEQQVDEEGTLIQRYGLRYYLAAPKRTPRSVVAVEQVRALTESLSTFGHGTNRVVLLPAAHLMNINAANALLKVLEEPPAYTVFLLVTDRPDLLPATIRSRCSRVTFQAPPHAEGLAWLADRGGDRDELSLLLHIAGGAPLLALELKESGFAAKRGRVVDEVRDVLEKTVDVVFICDGWKDLEAEAVLAILRGVLIDLVRVRFHPDPPRLFNPDRLDWLQRAAKSINLTQAFNLIDRIGTRLRDINSPLDKTLQTADFLVDCGNLTR